MMICKRPIPIYDVDLAGVGTLGALVALAYFLVVVPLQDRLGEYRALSVQQRAAEVTVRQTGNALRAVDGEVVQLETAIATLAQEAPQADSLPQFLSRATDLAKQARLEVFQVVPHAARSMGQYLITDVQMSGQGRSLDFMRFLDALARENPYHTLHQFSIGRLDESRDERCALSWTVRLYMLPAKARRDSGGAL